MPGIAEVLPNVYSIQQLDIYKTTEGLLQARLSNLTAENEEARKEQEEAYRFKPPNRQLKRLNVHHQHSLPPGVLLVSPREKTDSSHFENRVAPNNNTFNHHLHTSTTNNKSLIHKHSPSRCSHNICRYHQEKFLRKYHQNITNSNNPHHPNHTNIYERIVYPETEVLKMEKIANFRERVSVSHVEMPRKDIWKSLGAEFLGTFILMVIGCGCGLYIKDEDKLPLVGVALCWGFTVATLSQTIGHVSGCHMNPAVTLAMLFTRKIELVKSVLYIITQCISAIAAIAVLKAMTPDNSKGGYGVIKIVDGMSELQGFGIEFISTFILLFTIFSVSDENRHDIQGSTPLAVGLCIITLIFFGAPLTGAALNPARALGPAVVMGLYDNQWVYWVGPIGGAVTAAAVYEHIFRNLRPEEMEAAEIAKQLKLRETEANGSPPV